SVAIGPNAVANNEGDIALGSGSTTDVAVGTAGATIGGKAYTFAGANPTSTVSVGSAGAERTITNVAAGRLSDTSTDAVNGSQLFATNQAIDSVAATANAGWNLSADGGATSQNIAPGGTANFAAGSNTTVSRSGSTITYGVVADPSFNSVTVGNTLITTDGLTIAGGPSITTAGINAGGKTITNVAPGVAGTDAVNVDQLNAIGDVASAGWNLQANGDTATKVGPGGKVQFLNGQNIQITRTGTDIFVATTPDLLADSLTLNSGQVFGPAGLEMAGTKITGLAPGEVSDTSTEGINGSQLYGVSRSITTILGGDSKVNPDGSITGPTFLVQGNQYTTIYGAIGAVDSTLNNINNGGGIKYFHANSTLADSQAIGTDSVAVGPAAKASMTNSVAMGNGAEASANAGDVALGAGSKTQAAVGTSGASFNNFNLSGFAGTNPTSTVSVGDVGAERTITNVAAGRISSTSTDAINGSQMFALATQLDSAIIGGGGIKYFHTNSTLADSAAIGTNSTAIGPASTASATNAISMGNGANASANNAIAIGAGAQATKANSLALGAGSTTMANLSDAAYAPVVGMKPAGVATGEVSVGSSGSERRITNVAAGSAATDAVNVSQLTALANVSVKYDTDGSGNLTNRITLQGGDPNAPVTIGNVAPGVNGTDAVNVDQLKGAFDSLNGKIKAARREAWQGAAIGIAASSLQFDPRPGKLSAAVGGGMWHEQGALALGLGYTAETGWVRVNARAVTSGGDWGAGIGVSFTLN
ncbi:YadA-like family protein, partial [Inquilinus limosus]|uniref:YadA-like family protein n=1 Tax=Inquilinus limosus TaxID=171674 RepID=UPI003F13F308